MDSYWCFTKKVETILAAVVEERASSCHFVLHSALKINYSINLLGKVLLTAWAVLRVPYAVILNKIMTQLSAVADPRLKGQWMQEIIYFNNKKNEIK